jgi:hypothetical protein
MNARLFIIALNNGQTYGTGESFVPNVPLGDSAPIAAYIIQIHFTHKEMMIYLIK